VITLSFLATILLQSDVGNPNRFNDFLIGAYFVMGGIGLVYIISLAVRQRNLRQDLHLMHQLLQENEEVEE
jgi:hypothetical protein